MNANPELKPDCLSAPDYILQNFEASDRIAVLYLGRLVISGPASDFDRQSAVEYMTTGTSGRAPGGAGAA